VRTSFAPIIAPPGVASTKNRGQRHLQFRRNVARMLAQELVTARRAEASQCFLSNRLNAIAPQSTADRYVRERSDNVPSSAALNNEVDR
jgi:hypothetical protein